MASLKRNHSPDDDEPYERKKRTLPKRECLICARDLATNQFPSSRRMSSHDHTHDTCRTCYKSWVANQITEKAWDQISCPQCSEFLPYSEVKAILDPAQFKQYDQACLRAAIAADPDFRHCFSTACDAGQLHHGGVAEPIFTCQACGHRHCVVCEIPWHEDETYAQVAERRQQIATDEAASAEVVRTTSQPCPRCTSNIEKDGGCDHMTCRKCRHQFCWICSADYTEIFSHGNSHHAPTCRYHRPLPTRAAAPVARPPAPVPAPAPVACPARRAINPLLRGSRGIGESATAQLRRTLGLLRRANGDQ